MRPRGLTLLETVLALGLLPVLVLSLFFLFGRVLRLQAQSDDLGRAGEGARSLMEEIRALPYARLPATASFDGAAHQPANAQGFPPAPYPSQEIDGRLYAYRVRVDPDGNGRAVRVEAVWPPNHKVVLETRLAP